MSVQAHDSYNVWYNHLSFVGSCSCPFCHFFSGSCTVPILESMYLSRTLWVPFLVLPFVVADFPVLETGLLANESSVFLSDGCTSALESSISCDQWLQDNANEDGYSPLNDTALDMLCAPACEPSIISYRSKVISACQNDPQPFDGLPAEYFIDVIWASYNLTCLKDPVSGNYCNSTAVL